MSVPSDIVRFRTGGITPEAYGWMLGLMVGVSGISLVPLAPPGNVLVGLVLAGWAVLAFLISWIHTVRVTPGGVHVEGLLGGRVNLRGGLRLVGSVGRSSELVLGATVVERFPASAWNEATARARRCAEVGRLRFRDERVGDFEAWSAAAPAERVELELRALARAGLQGLKLKPEPPAELLGDHVHLRARIGDGELRSERHRFYVGTATLAPPPGTRIHLQLVSLGYQRWRGCFSFVVDGQIQDSPGIHLDEGELPALLWFAGHLDRTSRDNEGAADPSQVPAALRALRRTE